VRRLASLAGLVLLLLAFPGVARADDGERISSYRVALEIRPDGRLDVRETIAYDFAGAADRHGILREIPVRFRYDDTRDRVYPLSGVSVRLDGEPVPFEASDAGGYRVLKIGDPDVTVSGRHTYTIAYTARGALNSFDDHVELYWNAVGTEWTVPIDRAEATVRAPAALGRVACYAGESESRLPCARSTASGDRAEFAQAHLAAGEGLTTVAELPPGSVSDAAPVLEQRRDLASGFRATPVSVGGMAVAGLLGIAGAGAVLWRRGRDRRYTGQIPGLAPAPGDTVAEERVPLTGAGTVAVEFTPPAGLRPGQVGTLVDERANVVDVTATIIDFAVRGHLHIAELPRTSGPQDWELEKVAEGDFLPYERALFRALFDGRDRVLLSDLKDTFATRLAATQDALYADVVEQGWYRRSPAATRTAGWGLGILLVLGAAGVTFLLSLVGLGLAGLGLVAGALVFVAFAGRLPARTGAGSAMLARVRGFGEYLSVAEADRIRFEEREQVFSRYLPYAMVLGLADRWAAEFADLAVQRADGTSGLYWYTGLPGWNLGYFGQSIGSFTTTTAGTIASTPPSASGSSGFGGGGFSGGGGGGGGGGSW
jgi:hypothetical protein